MNTLSNLYPQPLWDYFSEILAIPRPSKKEEKMIAFLERFAGHHALSFKRDEAGNVLVSKPAFPGREKVPVVVLQTHLDMVCEKNGNKVFDFTNDPIETVVGEEWVSANGTTLGADDGIGIAAQLAVLASKDISHGPLECLFTVDEETGLTGAYALEPGFFTGKILINLDSEDEGEIFIGCAGGMDTVARMRFRRRKVKQEEVAVRFRITGLQGGHSGDDIYKGLGNAIKILVRFLHSAGEKYGLSLAELTGGNLRNAIAREAEAVVVFNGPDFDGLLSDFEKYASVVRFEYEKTEPGLSLMSEMAEVPGTVLQQPSSQRLINTLMACPHGVLEWSARMPGMVETSTNLASVKFLNPVLAELTTSQRSEIESRKVMAASMVASVFRLAGARVAHSDGYPGWTPNPGSPVLKMAVESYRKLFGTEPVVRSIHAGLECGLFLDKNPGLDMISIGPTIKGAHSPGERIHIGSVGKFWKHLIGMLEQID
jgi:dipeptidase D